MFGLKPISSQWLTPNHLAWMGYTSGVKRLVLGGLQVRASLQAYPSYASRRGTRLFDAFDHVSLHRENTSYLKVWVHFSFKYKLETPHVELRRKWVLPAR